MRYGDAALFEQGVLAARSVLHKAHEKHLHSAARCPERTPGSTRCFALSVTADNVCKSLHTIPAVLCLVHNIYHLCHKLVRLLLFVECNRKVRLARIDEPYAVLVERRQRLNVANLRLSDVEKDLFSTLNYLGDLQPQSPVPRQSNVHKSHDRLRRLAVSVDKLIDNVTGILHAHDRSYLSVSVYALRRIFDVAFWNKSIYRNIHEAVLRRRRRSFSLLFRDSLVEQANIHVVADRLHMSVLLAAEHRACTSYLKVTHSDVEARAELREFPYRIEPFRSDLRQHLASPEREISKCSPV